MMLADVSVSLTFSDVVLWAIIGALAGIVVGQAIVGRLIGVLGDLIVGALGALLANFLIGYVFNIAQYGLNGRIIVSIIGAVILIAIAHATPIHNRYPDRYYRRRTAAEP